MHTPTLAALATASLALTAAHPASAVILIDYDDGLANGMHDASIRNGGFEDNLATGGPPATLNYTNTDFWENRSGISSVELVRTDLEFTSDQNGALNDDGVRVAAQNTGYILSTGDIINFSYNWRDAFNWDDGSDQMQFSIYTTADDTLAGAIENEITALSGTSAANNTYQAHADSLIATGAMDGKKLFIALRGISGGGANSGFVRVDDVFVDVTPVPEPGSLALLGLGGLLFARRRR